MQKVRFITSPKLPRDWATKPYVKGFETKMEEDEVGRWLRRGAIEVLGEDVKSGLEVEAKPEPEPVTIETKIEDEDTKSEALVGPARVSPARPRGTPNFTIKT